MAESVEELTIRYEEDGQLLRKELDKHVLSKGSWTTIMFLYQDLDRKSGEFGPAKISIRRFQKREGVYLPRSKFEISSAAQARAIQSQIGNWFPPERVSRSGRPIRLLPRASRFSYPSLLLTSTGTRCHPVRPSYRSTPVSVSGCRSSSMSVARAMIA